MFRLYRSREFHKECLPSDYALIVTPTDALEQTKIYYDLNPDNYRRYEPFQIPNRLLNMQTWIPAQRGYADPVYDIVKSELEVGWLIGVDIVSNWCSFRNPFYIDENGQLVCENAARYHEWFVHGVMSSYQDAVANRRDEQPPATRRIKYSFSESFKNPQVTKTINSKAAGRLLAAGGIYNGNVEGFSQAAQQLGGDAPAGYKQVMDNKGLLIAGASIASALTLGKIRFPAQDIDYFGARGTSSGREFDPTKAGGPLENLSTDGVSINHDGILIVEKHISRFEHDPANDFMIERLKKVADGKMQAEQVDLNYYTHECREFQRYCNVGWEVGEPKGIAGYELWNNAHTATLEEFRLRDIDLFHPDAYK